MKSDPRLDLLFVLPVDIRQVVTLKTKNGIHGVMQNLMLLRPILYIKKRYRVKDRYLKLRTAIGLDRPGYNYVRHAILERKLSDASRITRHVIEPGQAQSSVFAMVGAPEYVTTTAFPGASRTVQFVCVKTVVPATATTLTVPPSI